MASKSNDRIQFKVGFDVDKSSLSQITKSLQDVQKAASSNKDSGLTKQFNEAAAAAKELEQIVNQSWNNKLNQLNLNKFNQSIQQSFGSVQNLKNQLAQGGAQGQAAFNSLASSVLNTNIQLKQSNKLLDSMATSMANTVKWGITASIFNNITGSIQRAFYYAKDLNSSLTDIRMVTGAGADQMQRFAQNANNISKNLGRSTLDFTKSAVEYYRQGLSDEEVQERSEITLKAQNITGAGNEMVDYLTSVWNGFKATREQAEGFVDSMALVADTSASDLSELATAMSKTAATANVVGVEFNQLNAMIATVVATTRLAPEAVGTAFKTIFARINDIKTGAEDAEISLGNYSGRMAELGVNVLDANGRLRDTGDVLTEVGQKWSTLTKEQQTYLASTIGGQRQITQVMALFDNWDQYVQLLNTSLSANGTLNEKNNIYLESTAAHLQQLGTQAQRTYDILINTDAINGLVDALDGALSIFNDFIQGLGGGVNAFAYFGSMVAGVFNKQISQAIIQAENNFKNFIAKRNIDKYKEQYASEVLMQETGVNYYETDKTTVQQDAIMHRAREEAQLYAESLSIRKGLTQEQQKQLTTIQQEIGQLEEQKYLLEHIQSVRSQIGAEDLTDLDAIKQRQKALKEQDLAQSKILSTLSQIEILNKREVLSDQDETNLRKQLNVLYQQGLIDLQQYNVLLEQEEGSENIISSLIKDQKIIYYDIHGQLQEITNLKQLQEALDRGDLEVINQQLVATRGTANNLEKTGAHALNVQKAVKGMAVAGQLFTAAAGALPTLMSDTATGAEKANAAFSGVQGTISAIGTMFGPIGMGVATLINGALSLVKSAFPGIERLFMSAKEKLAEFKNTVKEVNEEVSSRNKTISSLEQIQEEYARLSQAAGEYGRNVDKMTEEDKARYHELTNEFASYNDSVILGYDAQGNAIVKNQEALQQTIQLLREQRKQAVRSTLGNSNTAVQQANETLMTSQQASEEALQNNISFSEYSTIGLVKQQLQGIQDALNNEIQNLSNWYDGSIDELLGTIVDGTDKTVEEILNAFDWENFNYGDQQGISGLYNALFNMLKGQGGANIDQANTILNLLQEYDEFYGEFGSKIQDIESKISAAQALADQDVYFDTGFISDILQFGQGYDTQFENLRKSGFLNSDIETLILDYIDGFKYNADLVDKAVSEIDFSQKEAGTYDQIIQAGQNFITFLTSAIEDSNDAIKEAFEKADIQNADDLQGTITERIVKATEIINDVLSNLQNTSQYQNDDSKREALAAYIAQALGIDTLVLKPGENGVEIDTVDIVPDQILTDAKAAIEQKFADQKIFVTTEVTLKAAKQGPGAYQEITKDVTRNYQITIEKLQQIFEQGDLANIDQILSSIWGGVKERITNGQSDYDKAIEDTYNEYKKLKEELNDLTNIDFDSAFDDFDTIVDNLKNTKQLKDEQKEYLSLLELQDSKLKQLATTEGRGSQAYIDYLTQRKSLGQQIYLQEQQTIIDNNTALLKTEQDANKRLLYEQEIAEALYNQARAMQSIQDAEKERAEAAQKRQLAQAQTQLTAAQNMRAAASKISNQINFGQSQALTSEDLTALNYLNSLDSELAQIAQEQGIYSQEYLDKLYQAIAAHGDLNTIAQESMKAVYEAQKAQAQGELKKAQDQQRRLINQRVESQLGDKNALNVSDPQLISKMQAEAAQWLAANDERYQNAQAEVDKYTAEITAADLAMLQLQADTAAALQQASKHQISIDVMVNKNDLFDALANTQELSDAQLEYVLALEASDDGLAKIASTSGRYSKQYQQALRKIAAEDMKLYKQQIEEQKKLKEAEIETNQAALSSLAEEDPKRQAAEIAIQNAKNEIIRLDDQILIAEQAITKEIENQRQASLKLQQEQTQNSIANVKNLSTAIEHLKNSSQDITTSDYTAIYDWLNGHPELAELAGENYANIFNSSFISALERSYKNDKENVLSGYFSDAVKQAEEAVAEASQKMQDFEAKVSNAQAIVSVPDQLRNTVSEEQRIAAEETLAAAESERLEKSQALKQANIALLEAKSQENEQNRIALATEQERLNIFNQLTNREDLNPDEQLRLNTLMDDLIMKYPQLTQAANILKDTWMVGTQEYAAALKQVEDQLEALNYEELQNQLEDISINITLENLDDCIDQIEDFLDKDREIIIAIHTDAENEFNRLQDQMERIYDASSKIGQNFIVAADDVRELNNVFPGILANMQDLHDGTVQLSKESVQQAIAGASQVVQADAQSVNQQLQSQANLLHAKAANYRAAAQAAATLASSEQLSEAQASSARQTIINALMQAKTDMEAQAATDQASSSEQAANAEMTNLSEVATSSDENARVIAENFASAGASAAQSIYSLANSAIQNFAAIAAASQAASNGETPSSSASNTYQYSVSYGGRGGVQRTATAAPTISSNYSGSPSTINSQGNAFVPKQIADRKEATDKLNNSTYEQLENLFNKLANDAQTAATDIEGMIAETALDLSKLGKELSDAGSGRPKSGKGSGGGGGGGGSGKEPDIMDLLEDQYDRYHDINLELTRLANNFEKLAEEQEKLYGKQLIDNLNAQLQNLEDQISAYKFKIKLARIQQTEMQAALRQQGALFDKNGYLQNYNQLMFDKINKVNATIAYYNTLSAAEQETYKDVVEAAKEEYEKFKAQIEAYDTLISETIPELEKSIREKIDEQMQIRINHFKLYVEMQLDMSKAEREWNKFRKKVINGIKKDDILGNLDASFKDLASYFESGSGTGQIGALTDQVNKTLDQLHQMDETGTSDVYGNNRAQAMQDLQKYRTKLMQSLQDVEDIMDEIEQSIFDAIDETADALDNQAGLYEHISDIINHDVKVVELIYGDKAYDTLSKYYDMQHNNDLMHLDFLRQQKELWYQRMQIEQQRMSELDMQSNEWKSAQKRFNEYKEKWMQTTKELNSTVEDSIQNIIDKYTNTINKIFDQLEKKWTSGKGMSYLEEEWELINKQADLYLDKVNSMYEIQKLEKAYKDAINDAANDTKAQQSLNNLMQEQLKFLRDKDKLTQYDVDRANLLLQIETKRLALEQSRNNKTKLRLRRDRQGNYSYQYTSDDDQVASVRQELNDLMNELYNLTHNAYTENLDTLYKTVAEYEEKIKEVYEDTTLSAEEQQKKLAMYNEYYGNIINGLTQQNEELKQYMFEDTFNSLFYMYQNNLSEYESMTDEQKALMKDAFDYFYTTYGENLKNFNNMTQEERALAAYTFAEMARMYGLNVLDYRNMTAEQEALAADLFRTLDLAYTDNTAAFGRMTGDNVDKFQYLSDTEKQILTSQIVPHWNSSIQEMADTFAGSDGFISTCEDALKDLKQATSTYETDLKSIAEAAGKDFDLIKQGIDADITSTKGLIADNKELIEKLKEFINLVDKQAIQALAALRKNYNMAKTAAINAAKAAYEYTQKVRQLANEINALPLKKTIQIEYQQNTPTPTPYTPPASTYTPSYSPSGSGGTGGNGGYGGYGGGTTATNKIYTLVSDPNGARGTWGVKSIATGKYVEISGDKNKLLTKYKGQIQGYKTGGYTGDWAGQDGKLAILHQKEIVLNETDTKNILSAVNVVRALSDLLAGVGSEVSASRYANTIGAAAAQSLDQNVHITATFPNVTEHIEIEKALNSLVNRASQFAFRK